jgi:hypothetical protein
MTKSKMMKHIFIVISILFAVQAYTQDILQDPYSKKTFNSQKYSDIKGSAFLNENWITGSAITEKGTYENLQLKFDVYDNTLLFSSGEESFEFKYRIMGFTLKPVIADSSTYMVFKKGISGNGIKPDQFVQVLSEGKVSLFKVPVKVLNEISEINKGIIKTFVTQTRYYVMKDNSLSLTKFNKTEVEEALKDNLEKIRMYINDNKLSVRNERDVARIFKYYNSL